MMGDTLIHFTGSIAAAYIVAGAVWALLIGGAKCNLTGTWLAIIAISACPALIPPEHIAARAISCLLCIDPLFRVVDYARQLRRRTFTTVTWRGYCTFLIPFPFLLTVYGQKQYVRQTLRLSGADLLRLMACLAAVVMIPFACLQSHHVAVLRESFLIDHLITMILFIIFVESATQVQVAVERLCGFDAVPLTNHAYLARTPTEFWVRYNQRVRLWLYFNVFLPCGGRTAPRTGVIAVFLVSATIHEFSFALATSRLDGYQFAFFMLQAPAVILSPQLERLAHQGITGRFTAHGLTWLWFAITSSLFFHGANRVFPFIYASQPWLP